MKKYTCGLLVVGIIALTLAGCGAAPTKHDVTKSRIYATPFDQVWQDIVQFFASRDIPIKNIAKDSGVIYAEQMQVSSEYADCGKAGMASVIETQGSFNVFVRHDGDKQSVSVTSSFSQTQQSSWDKSISKIPCYSTGVIEQQILDSIH